MYIPSEFYDIFTVGRNIAGSHVLEVVSILFLHWSECLHGVQNKILEGKFFLVSETWKVT